ncbi:hypothetical protein HZA42_05585 [Candidatus Peregrinibacteria bacterium]|nr:hypothetical protein [Candidatus Peregrinibacteria bacterium]
MRYLVGLIGIPLGVVIVVYRERLKRFTGDFSFAEKWFGTGGTYTFLMIFGIAVSIGCLMYMLGTLQSMVTTVFGPFFGG